MLRPLWKNLSFQGRFGIATAETRSASPGGRFTPSVTFLGSDIKETVFATRNCYPVQSGETITTLDQRLNQLIKRMEGIYFENGVLN